MKPKTRSKEFEKFTEKQLDIMTKKAQDYAGDEDVLNNFKVAGNICGITPQKQCLSAIATKVARLGVLLDSKEANYESVDDTVIDLANYVFNLHCLIIDKEAH